MRREDQLAPSIECGTVLFQSFYSVAVFFSLT